MADSPEDRARLDANAEASALAELALCENLSQISGWAAKWSAELARADAALLWAPDTVHPIYLSIGAYGRGTEKLLRRSVPRHEGFLRDLLRDKRAATLDRIDFAGSKDPLLKNLPGDMDTAIVVPLEAEGISVGVLALLFRKRPNTIETMTRVKAFVQHAAPALARALRAERKTVGMLHAIERLTNLYDLSKAFGSTIELAELNAIILHKAVDFGVAEVASLWFFDPETSEVLLGGTVANENYDVENAPDAVGSSIVGDMLADRKIVRRAAIPDEDALAKENEGYPIRSILAFPLLEDDKPVGALVLANKRGRHPEFTEEDQELLQDLARQAVRALRNAREHEAEKKVEELDALLTVSRQITSTLDLDKVMGTIVNASAALVAYDQCALAILDRGKIRLGALSGVLKIDRGDPRARATQDLLEWVFFSGTDIAVIQDANGQIQTDRPETEEKFRSFFQQTGFRSFHGLLLNDDEGKLGVLAFLRRKPLAFEAGALDLLAILTNQATVAVRNAQLYKQVPLPGFLKPLAEKRRQLLAIPKRRRLIGGAVAAAALILLLVVPWRLRVAGPARILPGQRAAATAGVDGIVSAVFHREGDPVRAGEVIAALGDERYAANLEEARSDLAIAESDIARYREAGDAQESFKATSRRDELTAKIAYEADQFARTRIRAPVDGVIVTPRIEERVGQFLKKGTELCVVANVGTVLAEVAVPEADVSLVQPGERVAVKLNPYPTRIFHGTVRRPGSHVREEGKDRFIVAEVQLEGGGPLLKTGMMGKAKISTVKVRLLTAILRRPARWFWSRLWPLLP
ncbi:MAG TPA: GAF domain-containing protein [Thermoanaerobaculia bacterium]|jgi:RND family efflux transporter MFP subunit|nr:GAF domain-containing protein [Thermoanaerobaculia bacterium]